MYANPVRLSYATLHVGKMGISFVMLFIFIFYFAVIVCKLLRRQYAPMENHPHVGYSCYDNRVVKHLQATFLFGWEISQKCPNLEVVKLPCRKSYLFIMFQFPRLKCKQLGIILFTTITIISQCGGCPDSIPTTFGDFPE